MIFGSHGYPVPVPSFLHGLEFDPRVRKRVRPAWLQALFLLTPQ